MIFQKTLCHRTDRHFQEGIPCRTDISEKGLGGCFFKPNKIQIKAINLKLILSLAPLYRGLSIRLHGNSSSLCLSEEKTQHKKDIHQGLVQQGYQ